MASDLNRSIKIYIDGSDAQQGIAKVEAAVQKLEQQLRSLNKSEADYEVKSEKLQVELTAKNRTLETYRKKVAETDRVLKNLSGATYNELLAVQKQLRRELQAAVPGTEKYTRTMEQYQRVVRQTTAAQQAMRVEVGAQGSFMNRAADSFNRYAGVVASGLAAMTGLTLTMRQSVEEYAKMEEAESQVIKYTGMAKDEVQQLNEEFKNMDTRTPREELNRLAGEAGKLGITGRDNVREFVEAADMINVALGEDLGEEAVNQIGKLSQMFGDESRSLKDNMLAIGSAVNQVAQSSSASEPYLVSFTARMGGVGKQANLAVTDIMGYASALDQNMLRSEMASTALSGLILRLYQEPAKYAKLAKMDVQQFTELMQRDANAAVLAFLESLSKMGGMANIAPVLKEMSLTGAEAASVITTLAGNIDLIRKEQANANQAFREGTSIINEFRVQNNTVQAQLEKARKDFQEVRIELGERLQPVMKNMISLGSLTVKGLLELIRVFDEYKGVILTVTATVAAYTTVANLNAIATKGVAMWTRAAAVAQRALNAAQKASPWGWVLAAVTAATGALLNYRNRTAEVTASIEDMKKELGTEQARLDNLFTSLKNANEGTQLRRDLIKAINEQYGQYLPYLLDEYSTLDDIESAYRRINTELTKQVAMKYKQQDIDELIEKEGTRQVDSIEEMRQSLLKMTGSRSLINSIIADIKQTTAEFYNAGSRWQDAFGQAYHNIRNRYFRGNSISKFAAEDLEAYIESYYRMQQQLKKINEQYANWENPAPSNLLPEVVVTGNKKKEKLQGGGGTPIPGITSDNLPPDPAKVAPILTDEEVRANNLQQALNEETALYERHQRELTEAFISRQDETLQSEADYNEAMEQLNLMHLERLLDIAELDAEQRKQVEEELLDFKMKCVKEELDEQKRAADEKARKEEADAKRMQANYQKRVQTYMQYGQQVGTALGNIIAGQENAMQGFADTMLDLVFDVLSKIVQSEIIKATATATSAVARSTAEAYATPDSVLTFGASGTARAAVLSALIMGALAAAKSALKGLINNSRSDTSTSSSEGGTTYTRVAQHASGRYDVIGHEDGKRYRGVPYIGPAPTGIVSSPALISERGAELIVNADDLRRLQRHINYPLVVQAINESRGPVAQHAQGRYSLPATPEPVHPTPFPPSKSNGLLERLASAIENLERNGVAASVALTELERKQKLRERSRKLGSKR